jgi:hypothetical protein
VIVKQKNKEAALPLDKQHEIQKQRDKYAPVTLQRVDGRDIKARFNDKIVFNVFRRVQKGESLDTFLELYQAAKRGDLEDRQTFIQLCGVMAEHVQRKHSDNPNAKYGIRYPQDYLNFMILVRSHGGSSARQYGIIRSALAGPSPRSLR